MTDASFRHASWLTESVRGPGEFRKLVDMCKSLLRPIDPHFDVIVVCGLSGLLVGPTVALELEKYLVAVRKSDDECHSSYEIEGLSGCYRYVILDDLMSTGKTVHHMVKAMGEHTGHKAECLGVVLYRYDGAHGGRFRRFREDLQANNWLKEIDAFGRKQKITYAQTTCGNEVLA